VAVDAVLKRGTTLNLVRLNRANCTPRRSS